VHGVKHKSLPWTKKFKSVPSAGKVMLTLFFGILKGPSSNITRTADTWSIVHGIVLCTKDMKPSIHSKHTGMLINRVVLHHGRAGPHTAAVTTEMI